jgi:hypothetical protein
LRALKEVRCRSDFCGVEAMGSAIAERLLAQAIA